MVLKNSFLAPPNAKMRLHWWSYSQKFWLPCYNAQLKMVVHGNSKVLLYFLFLFFHLCSSVSLIFSTLSFSCSFLFSKLSLLLLKFFTQILFFFFSNFLSFFSIFPLLCEGLFFCRVGVGVGMVGHRHCGHAMGMVSHWFRVMLWVWVCVVVFVGLAAGFVWWVISVVVMPWVWWVIDFESCRGCGLPWVLFLWLWANFGGVVVVGCVKCWLTGGCNCFFFFFDKCGCDWNRYIILL